MTDFERKDLYADLAEYLDSVSEILEENNVVVESDEELSEFNDLLIQMFAIIGRD